MKGKGNIKDLDAIFRDNLESAELIPSDGLYSSIARKVAVKEFFSFNLTRINIWNAAGVAAAIITASILMTGEKEINTPVREEVIIADSAEIEIIVPVKPDTVSQSGRLDRRGRESVREQKRIISSGDSRNDRRIISSSDSTNTFIKAEAETLHARQFTAAGSTLTKQTSETNLTVSRFSPSTFSGCQPLSLSFRNNSLNYDSCLWTFGDGGVSAERNPVWLYDEAGDFLVTLTVFDKEGKPHQSQVKVTVHQRPAARFEISESKSDGSGEGIKFINLSTGASKYRWNFGDGNLSDKYEPQHRYQKSGTYTVTLNAISLDGCVDSLQLREEFKGNGYFINFPNALMANPGGPTGGYYSAASDQTGSVFHPVSSGIAEYNLKVYSKRGVLLFETNDINIGWDGYYRGQLCEAGVYVWKVRGRYRNGESFVKMGDLTLFKQ